MCGIAGVIGPNRPDDSEVVRRMTEVQSHRGPDGGRVVELDGAVLGFRRLSIIDLHDRAMQPMISSDGSTVLVYNGEIYNYKELRKELEGRYSFRTSSDSEVLLAAWTVWGWSCLERLNGMFAFCIFDRRSRVAHIARDRFGQKPIHIAQFDGRIFFSSEIKGLLAAGFPARPDESTWIRYLKTASYDDTAGTFFAGVTQLLPGECATIDQSGNFTRKRYYAVSEHLDFVGVERDVNRAALKARELIIEACRLHMRADVPVAIMLSGGLDSSAMLAGFELAGKLHGGIKCFSVEFGDDLTERPWIEAAAAHHSLPTHIDRFTNQSFRDSLAPMMWHLEGPLGGLMNCGLREVMISARDNGYVVLQDGSGPDEFFAGYRNHHNLYIGELLQSGSPTADIAVAEYSRNWGVDERTVREAAIIEMGRSGTAIDGTIPTRLDLLSADVAAATGASPPDMPYTGDRLRDSLIEYMQGSKIPRNMRMVDRLSMGYGLELRLPYLDPALVEFGLSLPKPFYYLEGRTKGVMRQGMSDAMNDGVRLATKRSIQAPQGEWLRKNPMSDYVNDLIHSRSFSERGFFDVKKVQSEFASFCKGGYSNSFFVWQWINVEEWFRGFCDNQGGQEPTLLCSELGIGDSQTTVVKADRLGAV